MNDDDNNVLPDNNKQTDNDNDDSSDEQELLDDNEESNEEVDVDDEEEDDVEWVSSSSTTPSPKWRRQRRQVDLSSHTQDGVPIYDRGYGVSLNRTEGLRIYQSLLSSGGRGEPRSPDINWNTPTEPPILPHHRQNSYWQPSPQATTTTTQQHHQQQRNNNNNGGRHHHHHGNNRARHHHQQRTSSETHDVVDAEQSVVHNEHLPTSSRTRGGSTGSTGGVEFRSSRVKPSATSATSYGGHHNNNAVMRSSWNAAGSGSGNNNVEDAGGRISAATAPAILTRPASSIPTPTTSAPRLRATTRFDAYAPVVTQQTTQQQQQQQAGQRRRINRKQLRDLTHAATAVHLVADTRNSSSSSSFVDNQGS